MLLFDDAVNGEIGGAYVLVFGARKHEVRKVVISLNGESALDRRAHGIQQMRWNFDVLAAPKFAGGFLDLGLIEVEDEMNFFADDHRIVAIARLALLGVVHCQSLAIA